MLEKRTIADELMDAEDLDPKIYAQVLTDLAKVNRIVMAERPTLDFLARAIGDARSFSVLDVGYGDGDMVRAIARWAKKRGIEARLTGIDLNPQSEHVARAATPSDLAIVYRTGDYADLSSEPFDFIISSLVAHHMTQDQLIAFLGFMAKHAKRGWLINDLHRHAFAYAGYPLLATLMRWHPIVRHDGRLSIARSYRPDEWPLLLREAQVKGARIFRSFPFRLCVEQIR